MSSFLPSLAVLGPAAIAALVLAVRRRSPPERASERAVAARVLALCVAVQILHFTEESLGGFPERLGDALGLPGMPPSFFFGFNLAWIGIWVASVRGVRSGRTEAFFAAWFLAIAGMVNGVAHPLLAVAAGGYFPGLLSSPIIAAVSAWLWLRLRSATR